MKALSLGLIIFLWGTTLAGPPLPYKGQVYRSLPDTVRFPGPRKARGDTSVREVKIAVPQAEAGDIDSADRKDGPELI